MTSLRKINRLDANVKFQDSTNANKTFSFDLTDLTSHKDIKIIDSNTTLVGIDTIQTLTNKSINADDNTITNIDNDDIKASAGIDASKIADGTVSNTEFQHLKDIGSAVVGVSDTQTLTNKTIGDNLNMSSNRITNLAEPIGDTDAATKLYVDGVASGLDIKESVLAATTVDLDSNTTISGSITYNNTGGSSGKGQITATLVSSDTFDSDGVTFSSANNGSRILIKDQINGDQNGIYTTTISGTSLTLDRATDFDSDSEVTSGAFTFVESGTLYADCGFVLSTDNPITIGGASGTSLTFTKFSGAGQITAGDGMTKTGNTLNVGGSSTIISNADTIEVNSSSTANQVLLSSGSVGSPATYGSIPLNNSNSVSGVLPLANGGTNTSSFSSGSRLIATNSGNTALEDTSINPNDLEIKKTNTVQTTTASTTTIATISTSSDVSYFIETSIVANNTTESKSGGFSIKALFRNDGGTLTKVSDDILEIKDNGLSWLSSVTTSGTDILIQVTGEAGKTINWKSTHSSLSV